MMEGTPTLKAKAVWSLPEPRIPILSAALTASPVVLPLVWYSPRKSKKDLI